LGVTIADRYKHFSFTINAQSLTTRRSSPRIRREPRGMPHEAPAPISPEA
jgi:hypothetical protein